MARRLLWILAVLALLAGPATATQTSAVEERIVGGVEVDPPGKYGFMAALMFSGSGSIRPRCGVAVIGAQWVVTAAHCFTADPDPTNFDVVIGRHDLSTDAGERLAVSEIIIHPAFDGVTLENDIALVRLASVTTIGTSIAWAGETDTASFGAGSIATVTGWGRTEGQPPGTADFPDALREVEVPIQSVADCEASYGSEFFADVMLCAGPLEGGRDACQGDSGNPLFVWDGNRFLHVGIVSWGEGCADPGFPGVYTRTASYAGWISETTGLVAGKTCQGFPATLVGTNDTDVLIGTPEGDVIVGRGGDDEIWGRGGDDLVCAGKGDDTVRGGGGDDRILGQKGDDLLIGQAGDDLIHGKAGADELRGGSGADELRGGADDDLLHGYGGADALFGGPGTDRCNFDEPIVVSCEIDP